jgi:hypothetical protein
VLSQASACENSATRNLQSDTTPQREIRLTVRERL